MSGRCVPGDLNSTLRLRFMYRMRARQGGERKKNRVYRLFSFLFLTSMVSRTAAWPSSEQSRITHSTSPEHRQLFNTYLDTRPDLPSCSSFLSPGASECCTCVNPRLEGVLAAVSTVVGPALQMDSHAKSSLPLIERPQNFCNLYPISYAKY